MNKTLKHILHVIFAVLVALVLLVAVLVCWNVLQQGQNTQTDIVDLDNTVVTDDSEENEAIPLTVEELKALYREGLEPSDDEWDFRYANDYEANEAIRLYYCRDSKAYPQIYGYSNVTVEQIDEAVDANSNISQVYKDFIKEYVRDWLELWPESDFSTLYHNLETLQVVEASEQEIMMKAVSTSAAATYLNSENTIYVEKGIDLQRDSFDYIILTHELTHCARNAYYTDDNGNRIRVDYTYFPNLDSLIIYGEYAEEALMTDLVYEMQGLGEKSHAYTLQSSYYRIILDCIDYDGADYMNHSVNYLIDQMDAYMGTEEAHYIVALIDAQGTQHYEDYRNTYFYDFTDLYAYLTRMYCKKYLTADMTAEQQQEVYDNLIAEVTYYFDRMNPPYELDYEAFETQFQECAPIRHLSNYVSQKRKNR